MPQSNLQLLCGFLLLSSVHWGGQVATTVLEHVVPVPYNWLPWLRVVVLGFELRLLWYFLKPSAKEKKVDNRTAVKLLVSAAVLFTAAHFDHHIAYFPVYCGNAFFDGTLDVVFESHDRQASIVHHVVPVLYAMGIGVYGTWIYRTQGSAK
ncbi:MAG: hypothetical protein ACFB10_20995 [Salibacteraceae bacterium]